MIIRKDILNKFVDINDIDILTIANSLTTIGYESFVISSNEIDVDVLSNRVDFNNYFGIAKELAWKFERELNNIFVDTKIKGISVINNKVYVKIKKVVDEKDLDLFEQYYGYDIQYEKQNNLLFITFSNLNEKRHYSIVKAKLILFELINELSLQTKNQIFEEIKIIDDYFPLTFFESIDNLFIEYEKFIGQKLILKKDKILKSLLILGIDLENKLISKEREFDIKLKEDIFEEINRIEGIENIKSKKIIVKNFGINNNKQVEQLEKIKEFLVNKNLMELKTYFLINNSSLQATNYFNYKKPWGLHSGKIVFLRLSLGSSLIDVYKNNFNFDKLHISGFEMSNIFFNNTKKIHLGIVIDDYFLNKNNLNFNNDLIFEKIISIFDNKIFPNIEISAKKIKNTTLRNTTDNRNIDEMVEKDKKINYDSIFEQGFYLKNKNKIIGIIGRVNKKYLLQNNLKISNNIYIVEFNNLLEIF